MWTESEAAFLRTLESPWDIQLFLNSLRYNDGENCKSPRYVLEERTAHCAEGAYFAAAALRCLGHEPLIVDLLAENDDDHLLAVFKRGKLWGAVAKSNTTVLRFREPVYRSLRELVMSYFDFYFNTRGEKSLKAYSRPCGLRRFDPRNWMTTEGDLNYIGDFLTALPHFPVLPPQTSPCPLAPADEDLVEACFLKAVKTGLYRPR